MKFLTTLFCLLFSFSALAKEPSLTFTKDNFVTLRGEIDDEVIGALIGNIQKKKADVVYLFIDSPGGNIMAGLEFINYLKHTDKKVHCVVKVAISMAFAITQFCEKRLVVEDAVAMQHVASYSLGKDREANNYSMAGFIRKISQYLDQKQAERIGMDLKEFKEKTNDDWWLYTGKEIVDSHVADEVIETKCSSELFGMTLKTYANTMFGPIELVWSGCPMIGVPLSIKEQFTIETQGVPKEVLKQEIDAALDKAIPSRIVLKKS